MNTRWAQSRAAVTSLIFAAVLVLAGCGGGGGEQSAGGGADQNLNVGFDIDLTTTDSVQIRSTTDRLVMGSTVYEPLFNSDKDGKPTPGLAKAGSTSEGNKVWVLDLQTGVKFQNGKDFSSKDVVDNFTTILDPNAASDLAGDFDGVESVEAVSPSQVKFTLKSPDSDFIGRLTDSVLIGDMDARAKASKEDWAAHPIGTGPYQWDSRVVGDNVTFKKFDGYWRGTPPLSTVVFKVIPDPTVAQLALKNGDLDVITNNQVSPEGLPDLKSDANLQVLSAPSNTVYSVYMDFGEPQVGKYKDVNAFHKGLAYLFNTEKIVPGVIGDYGTYADQLFPDWQPGHDPSIKPFPYDPEKGKELLTQAGFPPGSTLKFSVANAPNLCEIATAEQSAINDLGYKVDLTCSDASSMGQGPNYDWDVLFTRNSGRPTAAIWLDNRFNRSLAEAHDDKYTFESDQLDKLVSDIFVQTDQQRQIETTQAAQKFVLEDAVAAIPLYWADSFMVANKDVKGLVLSPLGWQSFLYTDYTKVSKS